MSRGRARSDDPGEMTIELFAPGMTPLHRVGLAGLAMTLEALADDPLADRLRAMGEWEVSSSWVHLAWQVEAVEYFNELLKCGLRVDHRGLIQFPGLRVPEERLDQVVALHTAVRETFLQHFQSRTLRLKKQEKETREMHCTLDLDGSPITISYKSVIFFRHQEWPVTRFEPVRVKTYHFPGAIARHDAFADDVAIVEDPPRFLALLFAPVGTIYFQIQRRAKDTKPTFCLVLPEINDLLRYVEARRDSFRYGVQEMQVAGANEAAMRVLMEIETENPLSRELRCWVVVFGNAPGSTQKVRVDAFMVERPAVRSLRVYRSVLEARPNPKMRLGEPDPKTGHIPQHWEVPQIPDLVAKNLLAKAPWWKGFAKFWQELLDASNEEARRKVRGRRLSVHAETEIRRVRQRLLRQEWKVLQAMVTDEQLLPEGPEARFVRACHEAWRNRIGRLGQLWEERGDDFNERYEREFEKVRISFARCKNAAMLRQALTDFWVRSGTIPTLQEYWTDVLPFLTDRWQEARDLALLALASYKRSADESA